jgi:hypothetical protein
MKIQWSPRLGPWGNARQDAQKGRPAKPQRVKDRGVPLGYVEGLNDARTLLAGFFSILLQVDGPVLRGRQRLCL